MNSISMYAVTLSIFPLSVFFLIFFIRKCGNRRSLNSCPPGSSGLPFLGEALQFGLLGSGKFISDRMKKYSPHVFQTSLFGEKIAIFCGADGNKFIFTNDAKLLTTWWPPSFNKVMYSVNISSLAIKFLKCVHDFAKTDSLRQYVPIMDAMARQHIEKEWTPYQQVKAYHLIKKFTLELTCRLFISVEDPSLIKKIGDNYQCVANGLFSVPIDIPGTTYNRAVNAGKVVREELVKIIKERRQLESQEITTGCRDYISRLLLLTDVNDIEISNSIFGVLIASYDTTSSAIAFVLKHLAELPHVYNEVLREHMDIAKTKGTDDLLTWEDIKKMKYSRNVVRETLRLSPPTVGTFRETVRDCSYAGFTIPKGWKTFWNVYTTHKDPRYFPDPEKFDPSRFEDTVQVPYSYVPFGGGIHMCPGKEYATLEVLVFLHNIVKRFKLEKVIPNEKSVFRFALVPEMGLPLRLHPNGMNPNY